MIATVNQRVIHRPGGTTPPKGFFFAKEARKRTAETRSERGWQTLQKLLKRAERKTVIARLRRKCDPRVKRSDP
jgi:hypothetical protein